MICFHIMITKNHEKAEMSEMSRLSNQLRSINSQNFFYDLYIEKEIVLCYTPFQYVCSDKGKHVLLQSFFDKTKGICKEGVDRRDTDG